MPEKKSIFRIFCTSRDQAYELYARQVRQSELYGFIEIEGLLFGERSSVVVDPAEESLRKEFGGVLKIMLPFQAVHRIDEVEKEGRARILSLTSGSGKQPGGLSDGELPPGKGPVIP
jgi:hypothetical protein